MQRLELKLCEEKIRVQSDALAGISQIHSHEIRHPLTNILGIIDIIKQEGLNKQYMVFLEVAARELDSVIRKVVSNSYKAGLSP